MVTIIVLASLAIDIEKPSPVLDLIISDTSTKRMSHNKTDGV